MLIEFDLDAVVEDRLFGLGALGKFVFFALARFEFKADGATHIVVRFSELVHEVTTV